MKIRTGFVSNSSSSSFLVQYREFFDKEKKQLISNEEVKALLKYGFKWVWTRCPFDVHFAGIEKRCKKDSRYSLAFDISCNQEDVAYFLTRELNVSFDAAVHYAHWYWRYRKGDKKIDCYHNYGLELSMYENIHYKPKRHHTILIKDIEPPIGWDAI